MKMQKRVVGVVVAAMALLACGTDGARSDGSPAQADLVSTPASDALTAQPSGFVQHPGEVLTGAWTLGDEPGREGPFASLTFDHGRFEGLTADLFQNREDPSPRKAVRGTYRTRVVRQTSWYKIVGFSSDPRDKGWVVNDEISMTLTVANRPDFTMAELQWLERPIAIVMMEEPLPGEPSKVNAPGGTTEVRTYTGRVYHAFLGLGDFVLTDYLKSLTHEEAIRPALVIEGGKAPFLGTLSETN